MFTSIRCLKECHFHGLHEKEGHVSWSALFSSSAPVTATLCDVRLHFTSCSGGHRMSESVFRVSNEPHHRKQRRCARNFSGSIHSFRCHELEGRTGKNRAYTRSSRDQSIFPAGRRVGYLRNETYPRESVRRAQLSHGVSYESGRVPCRTGRDMLRSTHRGKRRSRAVFRRGG